MTLRVRRRGDGGAASKRNALREDLRAVAFLDHPRRRDVNLAAEQIAQVQAETGEIEETPAFLEVGKSTSLSSVKSPRATEPKIRTLLAPYLAQIARIS